MPTTEPVLFATPIGLKSLGAEFDIEAPFSGCRLCGLIYQSARDRKLLEYVRQGHLYEVNGHWFGSSVGLNLLQEANENRERWRRLHTKRYHSQKELDAFAVHSKATGAAFTPEAANRLAPFGITPLLSGANDEEVAAALYEAPRAPTNE